MSGNEPAIPPLPPSLEIESAGEHHVLVLSPADQSAPLTDVLRRAGLPLNTRCGGRGVCDGCLVEVLDGKLINSHDYVATAVNSNGTPTVARACKCTVGASAAKIRIPLRSSMRHEPQIVADYQIRVPFSHDPLYQQIRIANAQTASDLQKAVEKTCPGLPIRIAPEVAQKLFQNPDCQRHPGAPGKLPDPSAEFYATVEHRGDHRLVTAINPEPAAANLGVAVDIGTTTVALILVDLADGKVLARASKFNEQVHLGEDVVTRINLCLNSSAFVKQLQHAVANETILPLLLQALEQSDRPIDAVRCLAFAGNTTMLHLLAGVDPTPMGIAPFTPVFLDHRVLAAETIFGSSPLAADLPCHLLPGAAAYVGADLSAGVVASGLLYDPGPSLLIDVGTNGEIILKIGDQLVGCATAAGPAFEGARLSSGMRAVNGAISHITFADSSPHVRYEVIGEAKTHPIGICGSAYIDFLAWAHAAGVLTDTGRINPEINGALHQRLIAVDHNQTAFRLAYAPGKQPILISGCDVASLLQAKAAIAAGILTLLNQFNLRPTDIRTVYLAGGFGTKMDRPAAIRCGLLPGFSTDQVVAVGNTALAGAYLFLMDSGLVSETTTAAAQMRIVELNLDPDFESTYIDQLSLAPA